MRSPFIQFSNDLTIAVFGLAARQMRKSLICAMILSATAALPAWAANHAILSSCPNNGDGASWQCAGSSGAAGAFNAIPGSSSLIRGDVYYVGAGKYNLGGATIYNTAENGSLTITFQAPTSSDFGGLDGFNAITMQGMAVFGPMQFASDYWVMNGVYNSNGNINTIPFAPAGCPPANLVTHNNTYTWITCGATYPYTGSGYGFKVMNGVSGQNCSTGACSSVIPGRGGAWFFGAGISILGNHVTVEFVEINGSMDQTQTDCDAGLGVNLNNGDAGGKYVTVRYVWAHDLGEGNYFDATNYLWLDHDWFQRAAGNGSCHGEMIGVRADTSGTYPTTDFTLSNSYISNMGSGQTAYFNTPNSQNTAYKNIFLFGNVFFCNYGEMTTAGNCKTGDGFIYDELESSGSVTNMVIVNNDMDEGNSTSMYVNQIQLGAEGGGYVPTWNSPIIENNIWSNPPPGRILGFVCVGAHLSGLNYAYNAYMGGDADMGVYPTGGAAYGVSCPSNTDATGSPTFGQLSSKNPYVNAGNSLAGSNDFSLSANTNAGANLSDLTPPNGNIGVDMLGHTRTTWSRGALEFGSSTTGGGTPNPPSGLTAVVN
jgi:hypothetical protein